MSLPQLLAKEALYKLRYFSLLVFTFWTGARQQAPVEFCSCMVGLSTIKIINVILIDGYEEYVNRQREV